MTFTEMYMFRRENSILPLMILLLRCNWEVTDLTFGNLAVPYS